MNKYICVREAFEWIYIGNGEKELSISEKNSLIKYLETTISKSNDSDIIEQKYNKIRFINYVGIIKIKNVIIEVIPKISLNNDINKDKKMLLHMLSKCMDLEINLDKAIDSTNANYNLLELILNKYINALLKEINKGLYHEYINKEDNLGSIKGKILFKENIKNKCFRKPKVFCSYEEYSDDNNLNHILKLACMKGINEVQDNTLINKIKKAIFHLSNVSTIPMNKDMISKYKISKQNKRFSECLELAKFILLNISNENAIGNNQGFSMLFEMNMLYEKYIWKLVKMISVNKNKKPVQQDDRNYLLINKKTGNEEFNLIPDIVIEEDNIPIIIIDTKWKAIEYNSRLSYKNTDIYQMYAYINSYKEAKRVVLLYPSLIEEKEYPKWSLLGCKDKSIEIKTIRLDEYNNTVEDLTKIILDI
ncbi:McrC family protein [Clostridium beijerinckii]|uniref:McrC family protein n=1 Tax=Clostridium beijerinckii TaxID=1520 RepID=UPI00098CE307|nr:McrC family protein [Clostridium beijerinckii]NRT77618.1 5-methylcytosine-specific restriction enzyme subunit McrC [Clostridium beijerinckii]OOM50480.1 5-methylcytosine-specific restriction enzyme subunit McrC [Clostridium beijerinckii]